MMKITSCHPESNLARARACVRGSVVWLRNREMKRLLLSISKVGMGFAMQVSDEYRLLTRLHMRASPLCFFVVFTD